MNKRVLVTGSSGYVANYIMLALARKYPAVSVLGMSRTGLARTPTISSQFKNIEYVKGDCLEPSSFRGVLDDVDACVHAVGCLLENKKNPALTYKALNRDTAVNMAMELNKIAGEAGAIKKNFVLLSSAKPPPFLPEYITTKQEAERYLFDECPNLVPHVLLPGFVYNGQHRSWSVPLMYGVDLLWHLNDKTAKFNPLQKQIDFLIPAKSTKLDSVGHFAIEGAMGNLDPEKYKVVGPEAFMEFEK